MTRFTEPQAVTRVKTLAAVRELDLVVYFASRSHETQGVAVSAERIMGEKPGTKPSPGAIIAALRSGSAMRVISSIKCSVILLSVLLATSIRYKFSTSGLPARAKCRQRHY